MAELGASGSNSEQRTFEFRTPRRISITVSLRTYQMLVERSEGEGRSISNLASFLLEDSLINRNNKDSPPEAGKRLG
ncbi:MAG: hypothetical protein ACOYLI_07920 [Synechococcus lacustris]|jgi:hypothetical protein